jgi:hypothetical protein
VLDDACDPRRPARQKWLDSGVPVQSVFTKKGELYASTGGWIWQLVVEVLATHCRGDVMKKILTTLAVAGSLAVASVATSAPAAPYYGGYYGGYGPYPYGYGGYYGYAPAAYPYAAPTCVWRRIWNGYTWVRACV